MQSVKNPANELKLPDAHFEGRNPDAAYHYFKADGTIQTVVLRWDFFNLQKNQLDKKILPYSLIRHSNNKTSWVNRWATYPRVLYNLPKILANPNAVILVTEGEKAAEAATSLFPQLVVTCSAGGSNAAAKTDWEPVRGRLLYICPDYDEAGQRYCREVISLCGKAGAANIQILDVCKLVQGVNPNPSAGYDFADALLDGLSSQQAADNLPNCLSPVSLVAENFKERLLMARDDHTLMKLAIEISSCQELSDAIKHPHLKEISRRLDTTLSLLKDTCRRSVAQTTDAKQCSASNQLDIAHQVAQLFGDGNLLYTRSSFYKYDQHLPWAWQKIDDREIKQEIHKCMYRQEITKQRVDSILELIKSELYLPRHQFDYDAEGITLLNGRLSWEEDGWQLKAHDKLLYATSFLPIHYDANGQAPRFLTFLEEVFIADEDKQLKKQLLLEAMGYSMLKTCKFEKYFILLGSGCNGKSVFVNTLKALLGEASISSVQLSQLGNRFQRAYLFGKLANIVTEIGEGERLPDAEIKALVSGERITVEQKYKDPFDFEPYATLWFATNHLPYSRDTSDAMARRVLIITFNRQFQEKEIDNHLLSKLLQELPGILNLALDALGQLLKRGRFVLPPSSVEALAEWKKQNDQVLQFIEDCCCLDPQHVIHSAEIYNQYRQWVASNGMNALYGRHTLTNRLKKFGVVPVKGTAGVRMLRGIRLAQAC